MNRPVIINENGFYIEDGVLLRYTGSETDITIPDEVNTIADYSFLENTNREKIEIVRLGANKKRNCDTVLIATTLLTFCLNPYIP